MKIVLPRTLLEPGTIPWSSIGNHDLMQQIKFILLWNFRDMGRVSRLPSVVEDNHYRFTTGQIRKLLDTLALNNGADWVNVESYGVYEKDEKIGYSFQVRFTIPGNTDVSRQWLNTYPE